MQRVYTKIIGGDPASKPNQHKTVLTFTNGAKKAALRLANIATRKRIKSFADAKVIPVEGFEGYPIEMLYGEELIVTLSANRAVTVLVSEQSDFRKWEKERAEWSHVEEAFLLPYPPYCESKEEVRAETSLKFYATLNATFLVSVFNVTSKKARMRIEVVRWSPDVKSFDD